MEAAAAALREVNLYPDGSCWDLTGKVAARLQMGRDQLIFGNGSNEVLELVAHVFLGPGAEAVMGVHGFAVYKLVTLLLGAKAVEWRCLDLPTISPPCAPRSRRAPA